MMAVVWDGLEVFLGDANNAEARIYARLASEAAPAGAQLSGRIQGPSCAHAQTLSATVRMSPTLSLHTPPWRQRADSPPCEFAGADLLAEAIVPDPCFWSPDLPFMYRVVVELRHAEKLLSTTVRMLGIRPLGARGRTLLLEGRPWVIRGAEQAAKPAAKLSEWRATDLAMVVESPSDDLCDEASRLGIWLLARVEGQCAHLPAELRRLARWPCIAAIVLGTDVRLPDGGVRSPRSILLGQRLGPGAAIAPTVWADMIVCEDSDPDQIAGRAAGAALPVIARQVGRWHDDLAAARRACDELQRSLAGRGEFVGYLV
jgi:hypothetical protein